MSNPLRRRSELADRLETLGFFRYAPPAAMASLKQDFQESGWAAVFGETGRLFHTDAENLAEDGVGRFLREIEPFLHGQGLSLNQVEDEFGERGYWITVNGKRFEIYNSAELNRRGKQLALIWGLSGARAFAIVNELLEAAGLDERLYAVDGGNDLFGFFLTPGLREVICDYPGVDRPISTPRSLLRLVRNTGNPAVSMVDTTRYDRSGRGAARPAPDVRHHDADSTLTVFRV